jgi:tetratricopeptide (TPR) repeat protein
MRPTNTKIDATLARYLLSDLSPKQASAIDDKLLADESYMERLNMTESALICDFICGGLSDDDRERLERRFLRSKEKARKIEIAQFLFYKAHQPADLDDEDPAFEYLLGYHSEGERTELQERAQSGEDFKARLGYAEYELILAYLREGLSSTERERFERYFLRAESPDHAERIGKLRFTEVFCAYARWHGIGEFSHASLLHRVRRWLAEPVSISMSRPAWQPLVAVSVVGLGALIWALFFYQSPITKGLNALQAAYAQERPVEARISDFRYAAYLRKRDGDSVSFNQHARGEADRLITNAAASKEDKSAGEYYALGNLYLTERNFNQAAEYFSLAVKHDDRNAKYYNDLAVALMAKEKEKNPGESAVENYAEAVDHLHRAIALDASLLEARFNLALCREYQMLWRQAAEDWRKYLEIDPDSRWAEEARNHLRAIEELIKKTAQNREQLRKEFRVAALRRDGEVDCADSERNRTQSE